MSLRARLLAGLGLVAIVLLAVLGTITKVTYTNLMGQVDTQLREAAVPARAVLDRRPPGGGAPHRRFSSLYVGYVVDGAVETVVAPDLLDDRPLPVIDAAVAEESARTREPVTVGSDDGDLRYRVLGHLDERSGAVVVLGQPIDSVDAAMRGLVTVELIGAGAILLTLAMVGWWVIHLGIRPVQAMTDAATAIGHGDLSQRVPDADPRTEAGELGAALNEMLTSIEGAFTERTQAEARLRQFVADASHELRTPVATIRGYAELYRTGGLSEGGALDDAMRRTEQESIRMGRLVDDLLSLARLDQGRPLDRAPVDLAQLARDAASDALAVEPSRSIEVTAPTSAVVIGDEQRLRQVLANLVTNALVHTPAGTPTEIRVTEEGELVVLEVVDHGPGMPPEAAQRAFERFYRADPSRSRHRGGSGLGLAIVDAAVSAHGGSVSLRSVPGHGTAVRVEIPLATSS